MDNKVLVSVVMSVYNGEKYLKDAIDSILAQTYKNFEFIIINDGSKDASLNIIKNYAKKDKRIIFLDNNMNKGLIYSLNRGLKESTGKYIARMDADDIAFADRFAKQVEFLEKNEDVVILGTANNVFVDGFKFVKRRSSALTNYQKVRATLLFRNCMTHPTVMMRNSIIKEEAYEYSSLLRGAEDYGLWCEVARKYKISNINEITINYRLIKTSITSQENKDIENRYEVFSEIYKILLNDLGIDITEKNTRLLFEIQLDSYIKNPKYKLKDKLEFLELIIEANKIKKVYDNNILVKACADQFYKLCVSNNDIKMYLNYKFADLDNRSKFSYYKQKIKLEFLKNIKRVVR